MNVEEWWMRLPSGKKKMFLMEGAYDFVVVFGITQDKKVLVIKQFYISQQKRISSFVMGIVERGEKPAATAKRELQEETGYKARRFVSLGISIKGKYLTKNVYYYLALDIERVAEPRLEPSEDITIELLSLSAFKKLLMKHRFEDVFAEVAAVRALQYLHYQL